MTHRQPTIVASVVALAILTAIAVLVPVPYVRMSPGPAVDVLGGSGSAAVMRITGHRTYPTSGRLDLTTVSATAPKDHITLISMLAGWLDPTVAVLPRSYLYPPTVTAREIEQQNAEEMTGSQNAAIVAGLALAKVPGTKRAQVTAVLAGSPADGQLKAADFLLAVDGRPVTGPDDLRTAIRSHPPGDRIRFTVLRGGARMTVPVVTKAATDDATKSQVGIDVGIGFDTPVHVEVRLPIAIGGPSAGMMFALSLYDEVTPGELAGGRTIAGTGTIDADGAVGAISGIQQKIYGARAGGASVFLSPAANCDEAAAAHIDNITIYRVSTLNDSVTVLRDLDAGTPPTVARCG
jgi:PDZ domain-containing protein